MKRTGDETRIIGKNIRKMREIKGYSQREIGQILKISFQQIQKYESGVNRVPAEKLFVLQQLYAVPFSSFFDGLNPDLEPLRRRKDITEEIVSKIKSVSDEAFKERLFRAVSVLISREE